VVNFHFVFLKLVAVLHLRNVLHQLLVVLRCLVLDFVVHLDGVAPGAHRHQHQDGCSLPETVHFNNSMEQSSSSGANSRSASQEISCLLWKPKFHYRVHKSLPLVPILSKLNSVYIPTRHAI
jgi:hypothetical protein